MMEEPNCPAETKPLSQLGDIQQLLVIKEEQTWSLSLDHEDQKPPQIKEEEEEADITEFIFNPVPVKSEDDEEKPQPSELHHSWKEESTDSVGSDLDHFLESDPKDKTLDSSETDVSDGNWEESGEPQSDFYSVEMNEVSGGGIRNESHKKLHRCTECGKTYKRRQYLLKHNKIHAVKTPFSCSVCNAAFIRKYCFERHMRIHFGEKPFGSSVCGQNFRTKESVAYHMTSHTSEKPFSCSVCLQCFRYGKILSSHKGIHTKEKPFRCNVCNAAFGQKYSFVKHMKIHTGETLFSFSE